MSTYAPTLSQCPQPDEYGEYYQRYVSRVDTDDIVGLLAKQFAGTVALIESLDPDFRYAPDKWTVKQVVGHMIETERIMAHRALLVSRGDQTPLPGFDQDLMIQNSVYAHQPMVDLLAEFAVTRQATLHQFRPMTATMWGRRGTVSGYPTTTRGLAYIIAGHELYHQELFRQRYQ